MKPVRQHSWDLSPKEAIQLQKKLAKKYITDNQTPSPPDMNDLQYVCGADVSYSRKTDTCYAAVVVFHYPSMEIAETSTAVKKSTYPYVPGLLTFREAPPLIAAFARLRHEPDLLVFDGQGAAHPRRFGLAAHIGVIFNKPSIGCAKSVYIGEYREPGREAGRWTLLKHKGETIGCMLRSRDECKPLVISAGYNMTLSRARRFIKKILGRFRSPEIIRRAHILSNEVRKQIEC